jgi:Putative beta-barrel porin-2, OmpL-like. bbp2
MNMRTSRTIAVLGGIAALVMALGVVPARAEEEAPADPTRGQWDSFLDGFRDFEDSITGVQKDVEDASKIHIGAAFVEAYTWNFNEPSTGINSFRSLDPDHNTGTPAAGQLSLLRPSEGFIPGFGLKLLAGRVAKRSKADWNGNGGLFTGDNFEKNSFEVEEAYLQYTLADTGTPLDGLNVKGGKWVTTAGAEVIEPWLNYNYSRSFLFGLAIPFTHTGVIATYPITDKLSVSGAGIGGWDNVNDNNQSPSFLGNAVWTITDQVTLAGTGIYGPEQNSNVGRKRALGDVVLTVKPCDPLTLVLNYDYAQEDKASLSGGTAKWQGFAAIANYAFTDRFSVALRGEWFEDHGGSRTGARQTLYEGTVSAKYLITQHLYGRLEMRRDDGNKDTFLDGTEFSGGQTTVGFDVGWVFN